MRDLTDATPVAVAAERARVPREGLGAAILARQESDGAWRRPSAPAWLTTLFTLQLLRTTGIDPADPVVELTLSRAEQNLRWSNHNNRWDLRSPELGGNPFFEGEVEPCINGGVLAFGAYFGHPNENLARRLLSEQLEDGGWNCEAPKSTVSSFHTTVCVLEGLLQYERAAGAAFLTAPQTLARACRRSMCATARRGVPALARSLPASLHRRGREPRVPRAGLPAPLPLRHSPRARLLPSRSGPARPAHDRSRRGHSGPPSARWPMAP